MKKRIEFETVPLSQAIDISPAFDAYSGAAQVAQADRLGWFVSFASFVMLLLIAWSATLPAQWATTVVVLLFIAPWGIIVLRQPNDAFRSVILSWPLLALPLLAFASVLWSDYPGSSFRGSLQYIVTTLIGIWAGYCIKPRVLMSALLAALMLVAILSLLTGTAEYNRFVNEYTLIGLFGSKNYFALCIALLLLTAVAVAFDKSQPRSFRIMGVVAAVLSPPLLLYARSVGALVVSIATLALVSALRSVTRLPPGPRFAVLSVMIFVAILVPVLGSFSFGYEDLLNSLGKETTLTGRTLLWQQAVDSIAERPVFGSGFQAFWQVGNWRAEQLWLYSYIPNKYGYHFHNTYFAVGVELGLVGLFVLLAIFLVVTARILFRLFGVPPRREEMFAVSIFIFFLLRSPIEVDVFFQFQIAPVLLCLIWIYLTPIAPVARKRSYGAVRAPPAGTRNL